MIDPNPAKIEDILKSSVQYVVPKYQREYTWGKEEALELISDLKAQIETADAQAYSPLFLGSMIFDISDDRNGHVTVVDGQQRITTLMFLLVACRERARELKEHGLAALLQERITFVDPTTANSMGNRLIASDSIREIFDHIANSEWNKTFPQKILGKQIKRQVNKVKPVYEYFYSQVAEFNKERLSNFLYAIYNSYVVRINIQDEIDALNIFERTNARGVDLEASDLLKNFLFKQQVDGLEEYWQQIVENSGGTLIKMIKYFYLSQRGSVAKTQLYKQMKDFSNNIGAKSLVEALDNFSRYYYAVRSVDNQSIKALFEQFQFEPVFTDQENLHNVKQVLESLRFFNVTQAYPLIYSIMQSIQRLGEYNNKRIIKKFMSLLKALEKYHFINNKICERVGNEVEKLYADTCIAFQNTRDINYSMEDFIDQIRSKLATKDEFISRFKEITYSQSDIGLIVYIFDRINNFGLSAGQNIPIFNPDQKVLRKSHNIEHFYPRNPDVTDGLDSDIVDNIGNLLVISFRVNSSLGNLLPDQKIIKLESELSDKIQNNVSVGEFIKRYRKSNRWGAEEIVKRSEELAIESYDKFWCI